MPWDVSLSFADLIRRSYHSKRRGEDSWSFRDWKHLTFLVPLQALPALSSGRLCQVAPPPPFDVKSQALHPTSRFICFVKNFSVPFFKAE